MCKYIATIHTPYEIIKNNSTKCQKQFIPLLYTPTYIPSHHKQDKLPVLDREIKQYVLLTIYIYIHNKLRSDTVYKEV